jgi:excisionase family DNA binding protein
MNENSELLPIKVFCERFGVSRTLTYREIGAGRLPALKVGKLTRIALKDARAWADALPRVTPKAAA